MQIISARLALCWPAALRSCVGSSAVRSGSASFQHSGFFLQLVSWPQPSIPNPRVSRALGEFAVPRRHLVQPVCLFHNPSSLAALLADRSLTLQCSRARIGIVGHCSADRRRRRQRESEDRAASRVWFGAKFAAMLFNDRAADRQADTHPLRLCRKKRLKQPLGNLRGEAGARYRRPGSRFLRRRSVRR